MGFPCRVARLSLRDRMRSSDIQERLKVELLLLHVERSQLRWFRHLAWMPPVQVLLYYCARMKRGHSVMNERTERSKENSGLEAQVISFCFQFSADLLLSLIQRRPVCTPTTHSHTPITSYPCSHMHMHIHTHKALHNTHTCYSSFFLSFFSLALSYTHTQLHTHSCIIPKLKKKKNKDGIALSVFSPHGFLSVSHTHICI